MRCSRILPSFSAALMVLLSGASTPATTIHVPGDAPTITAGLASAASGDTVLVAHGQYLENDLAPPSGVCLRGSTGNPADVIIDAQQQGRVISCADLPELVRIEDLTLTGGLATMETSGSHTGGGLFLDGTQAEIRNCRIINNEAETEGGGIACYGGSDALISGCVITGNRSIDGAGISCNDSSPLLENCIIASNEGLFWGGALFCRNGSNPWVVGCTLVGNKAHWGSGIWALDGPEIRVENSIIAFGVEGEGIHTYDNQGYPSVISLSCCNVFGNEGGGYGGTSQDQTGINGNLADNPIFCDWEGFDFSLDAASPCLPENNDCGQQMGALGLGCDLISPVDDDPGHGLPGAFRLVQNSPNPFNPQTEISFELGQARTVSLVIHDSRGRLIRNLVAGQFLQAGVHHLTWDGSDGNGRPQPSGVYLYRLTTEVGFQTRKMTLAR